MDDFTFVSYLITFPITMRDDVPAPCTSVSQGKPFKRLCRGKERTRLKIASDCPWSLGKGRAKAFPCSTAWSHTLGAAFLAELGREDSDRGNICCALCVSLRGWEGL